MENTQTQSKTADAEQPSTEGLSSSFLLSDLVLVHCGWRTESEQKRYLAANERIMKEARKMHLRAELESLG
jgi:hypothetical protein